MNQRDIDHAASALRAHPEPHHKPVHPRAGNDDWQQVPDGSWGQVLVALSVLAVVVAMVMM